MPDIKLSQVMAFSSEDPSFPAKNLLCSESYKKWKSKSAGEKEVSVLLKFENSSQIEAVHIGNEGSAFVEILVGKLGEDVRDFQVLLPTSSFMSPAESRSSSSPARVRLFERDKLSAAALGRPWDCARIVCTQPFCRTAAYGLAFVRFRSASEPAPPRLEPAPLRLGAFTLRPESEDDIRAGGLFRRRAEPATGGGALKRDDRADRVVPPRRPPGSAGSSSSAASEPPPPQPSGHYQLKADTRLQQQQRRRSDGPPARPPQPDPKVNTASPSTPATNRPNSAPNKPDTTQKRPDPTPRRPSPTSKRPDTAPKRDQNAARGPDTGSSARSSNGVAGSGGDANAAPRPPPNAIYRPLRKLLSGVVFAMSGYQNPLRSDLREQAIKLGASYRPDWGPGCTHLICAFRNTPKFAAVRGRGKIVRGEWLTACGQQKRRLPWRQFATDPGDGRQPDSGDELWAEELRPLPPPAAGAPRPSASDAAAEEEEYGGSTDDEEEIDTDDEIRMVQEQEASKASTSAGDTRPSPSDTTAKKRRPDAPQLSAAPSESRKRSSPAPSCAAPPAKRVPSAAGSDEAYDAETDEDEPGDETRRPDTAGLQVPGLPDFLRGRTFLLYGDAMSAETRRQAARTVTAFGGRLEQYFGDSIKYVVTEDAWDGNFDEAAADLPELMFVRPDWLQACARKTKLVALQPYLVTAGV